MAKNNDMDYLFLCGRLRAMERKLLSSEKIDRMLEAEDLADAAKVLADCGYPEVSEVNVDSINAMLSSHRDQVYSDLYLFAPDSRVIDVFRVKYDYHNAKVILKAEAKGIDGSSLLVNTGLVKPEVLEASIRTGEYNGLAGSLRESVAKAREVLGATKDPQLCDFVLDSAYFKDMKTLADDAESDFLKGYVAALVDCANLKSLVRTLRMGKDVEFLKGVLFEGGNVDTGRIINSVNSGNGATEVFAISEFAAAAAEGDKAISVGSLTEFEKLCDNAVMAYVKKAKYITFGEASLIAYLAASESDFTAVRIIMTGRLANLDTEIIRERLRETYV